MKTADLDGLDLNYWVGQSDNRRPVICSLMDGLVCLADGFPYFPSVDWRQGGPIIEREKIMVAWNGDHWIASATSDTEDKVRICSGPTALAAAMRAFVQSKFGDSVLD